MNNLLNYNLIGIGEFSHGIIESWQFRFNLLKYAIKNSNKNIIIFNEMSIWQADNIMNNTIWSIKDNKYIDHKGIKIEEPIQNDNYVGGKLWQYCGHTMESKLFLKIIMYIRKHKDRITIIGIDNDKIDRDYNMYKIIMKNYNKNNKKTIILLSGFGGDYTDWNDTKPLDFFKSHILIDWKDGKQYEHLIKKGKLNFQKTLATKQYLSLIHI